MSLIARDPAQARRVFALLAQLEARGVCVSVSPHTLYAWLIHLTPDQPVDPDTNPVCNGCGQVVRVYGLLYADGQLGLPGTTNAVHWLAIEYRSLDEILQRLA